jgi:hypothetical protein
MMDNQHNQCNLSLVTAAIHFIPMIGKTGGSTCNLLSYFHPSSLADLDASSQKALLWRGGIMGNSYGLRALTLKASCNLFTAI